MKKIVTVQTGQYMEKDVRRQKSNDGRWEEERRHIKTKETIYKWLKSPNVCTFNTMNIIVINTVNIELSSEKTIVKEMLGMLSYEWILYSIKQNEIA